MGDVSVALTAKQQNKTDVAFTAVVSGTNSADGQPISVEVCDDAGKVRTFKDADDYLKAAGALGMVPNSTQVSFANMVLVAPKPFTGDIIKRNQALVVSYGKRKTDGEARAAKLQAEITLMESDPAVPVAMITERETQKSAVDALTAWLATEISRINAILAAA